MDQKTTLTSTPIQLTPQRTPEVTARSLACAARVAYCYEISGPRETTLTPEPSRASRRSRPTAAQSCSSARASAITADGLWLYSVNNPNISILRATPVQNDGSVSKSGDTIGLILASLPRCRGAVPAARYGFRAKVYMKRIAKSIYQDAQGLRAAVTANGQRRRHDVSPPRAWSATPWQR